MTDIDKVNSLEEAALWFLSHHIGSVVCVDGEREQECQTYPEAQEFYTPATDTMQAD